MRLGVCVRIPWQPGNPTYDGDSVMSPFEARGMNATQPLEKLMPLRRRRDDSDQPQSDQDRFRPGETKMRIPDRYP